MSQRIPSTVYPVPDLTEERDQDRILLDKKITIKNTVNTAIIEFKQ